jgi:hypothetical protein
VRKVEVVPYDVKKDIQTREMRASFDSAAVRAVRSWTFQPATEGTKPVSQWWTLRVPFSDPENDPAANDSTAWSVEPEGTDGSPSPIEREAAIWPAALPYLCRGRITVRLFPGPDGRIWAVNVARVTLSCQDASLRTAAERAAVRAARRWQYRPGEHDGDPIMADFVVPAPRLDAPVIVGCVRDSASGRLWPETEVFGREDGHAFGMTDDEGWFVLRGAATQQPRLRARETRSCRAGGFRAVRPWKQRGDEVTLYLEAAPCPQGKP